MRRYLSSLYDQTILDRPVLSIVVIFLVMALVGSQATHFELDASADSLVLEHDAALRYYRAIRERYGSDDFLLVTYTPKVDLFSEESLSNLRRLRDRLLAMQRVESVVTILDVPLINSPRTTLAEISEHVRTLEGPDTDRALARQEFLESPLYANLLVSPDARTTALQVIFLRDETYYSLLKERDALREKASETGLEPGEHRQLAEVVRQLDGHKEIMRETESRDIAEVRDILDEYRDRADLYLGGLPMVASDMIDFIRHDLVVFGLGVLLFLVGMLAVSFRRFRWVFLPMLCCFSAVLFMFGYLGLVKWPVTVVSSNFTSLLLIITLSLTVHLVVRYHEVHDENPSADQRFLVREMVHSKALPSLYTALTTFVAFGSLLVSDIRPVIDFGWMMAMGIAVAFLLSFILLPASLMLLKPDRLTHQQSFTAGLTRSFAVFIEKHAAVTLVFFAAIAALSVMGISMLTVENRFIDHFKQSTDIYRGMEMIDRELGGTTPLDVIVDAPADFLADAAEERPEDAFEDVFQDEFEVEAGLSGTSYWYNSYRAGKVLAIHDYLDGLPEIGKTLSLATTLQLLQQLNNDKPLDNFTLSVIYKKLPASVKKTIVTPYMSSDGNQARFSMRVFETDPTLRRNELLRKVRRHLVEDIGLGQEQVRLTGMLVLYNNMLQSLHRSQIQTLGVVFLAIMAMFVVLFRSLRLAVIAIIPNLVAAGMVLGLMGWLKIPLDIMTITIAAITIGIAVDDTIHYIHRFQVEIVRDDNARAAVRRCHAGVGRAMYYTSVIVIVGFSILALSDFKPTIYFGLLTGAAMAVALVANLSLLPLLLILFRGRTRTSQGQPRE